MSSDSNLAVEELQRKKLMLEIKKLETETSISELEAHSRLEKLRLETLELRRWTWTKPATLVPVLATIATIAFAQYQGLFDIQAKRLDLESKELVARNRELVTQQNRLAEDVKNIKHEQDVVTLEKLSLEKERGQLRSEVAEIRTTLNNLQIQEKLAREKASEMEQRYSKLYTRIREVVRSELLTAVQSDCGKAYGGPSFWSAVFREDKQPQQTSNNSSRDWFSTIFDSFFSAVAVDDSVEAVFRTSPERCLSKAVSEARLIPELIERDRSFILEQIRRDGRLLNAKYEHAKRFYKKYSEIGPNEMSDLPPLSQEQRRQLESASDNKHAQLKWRRYWAMQAIVAQYNQEYDAAYASLRTVSWPK